MSQTCLFFNVHVLTSSRKSYRSLSLTFLLSVLLSDLKIFCTYFKSRIIIIYAIRGYLNFNSRIIYAIRGYF